MSPRMPQGAAAEAIVSPLWSKAQTRQLLGNTSGLPVAQM